MDILTYNININSSCGQVERRGVAAKSWISYYDNGISNLLEELYNEVIRLTEIEIANGTFNADLTMIEDFFISVYDEDEKITVFSKLYYLHLPAGVIANFRHLGHNREVFFDISFNDSTHYPFSHKSDVCWTDVTRKEIFELVKAYLPAKRSLLEVEKITICREADYKCGKEIWLYPWERLGYYSNLISMEEVEIDEYKEEIEPVPCDCGGVSEIPEFYIYKNSQDFYSIGLRCRKCLKKIETFLTADSAAIIDNKNTKKQKEKIIKSWNVLNEKKDN